MPDLPHCLQGRAVQMPSPSVLQVDLLGWGWDLLCALQGVWSRQAPRPGLEESLPVTVPLAVCLEVGLLFGLALESDPGPICYCHVQLNYRALVFLSIKWEL